MLHRVSILARQLVCSAQDLAAGKVSRVPALTGIPYPARGYKSGHCPAMCVCVNRELLILSCWCRSTKHSQQSSKTWSVTGVCLVCVQVSQRGGPLSFTGPSPTRPWTDVCKAFRTGQRISGEHTAQQLTGILPPPLHLTEPSQNSIAPRCS
jgi:hypothetical protein